MREGLLQYSEKPELKVSSYARSSVRLYVCTAVLGAKCLHQHANMLNMLMLNRCDVYLILMC